MFKAFMVQHKAIDNFISLMIQTVLQILTLSYMEHFTDVSHDTLKIEKQKTLSKIQQF